MSDVPMSPRHMAMQRLDQAAAQQPQADVGYREAESEQTACGNCEYFQPPNGCSRVEGEISPVGTCDLFEPRQEVAENPMEQTI